MYSGISEHPYSLVKEEARRDGKYCKVLPPSILRFPLVWDCEHLEEEGEEEEE